MPDGRSIDNYRSLHSSVPGWLGDLDFRLFELVGRAQHEAGVEGDILEIGAYAGKSAILLGFFRRANECLTVCDLFDAPAPTDENLRETTSFYAGLQREQFEQAMAAWHERGAEILQMSSTDLPSLGLPANHRIVHIDGSHLYDVVHHDVATARSLVGSDAVVIFDDYRNHGHPGVAAAVWGAVAESGLVPLVLSPGKLYGSWSPDGPGARRFVDLTVAEPGLAIVRQRIAGHDVAIVDEHATGVRLMAQRLLGPASLDALGWARTRLARVRAALGR